jgi:hypothetical protein
MIDFTIVTREFRSLVDRRRDIQTFLGSAFAAMSLVLGNVLEGKLPPSLREIQEHLFAFYSLILMVVSLLLSLRMARLHSGMALNGVLYARLLQAAGRAADPRRAARLNVFGVSFLQFILAILLAAFSGTVLLISLKEPLKVAVGGGAIVFVVWLLIDIWFYRRAVRFANEKIRAEEAGPVSAAELEEHVSVSLQQANHGLITEIAFAGLIVFSCFGTLSSLGKIEAGQTDLPPDFIRTNGPIAFAGLMLVVCLFELIICLRLRLALGQFSLQLDATDRPYRPLRLTDSLLGYMLLAFLFVVSLHVLLLQVLPEAKLRVIVACDAIAFAVAILVEQVMLVIAGRRS